MTKLFFSAACVAAGLCGYLSSSNGGGNDTKFINTLVRKVLDLLRYTKFALDGTDFSDDDHELVREAWLTAQAIASDDVSKISEHLDDLRKRYQRHPLTLRQYVTKIKVFYGWFYGWFPLGMSDYTIEAHDKVKLDTTLRHLSSYYYKLGKKVVMQGKQSIEEKVSCRTWPENGFQDLLDALAPHVEKILAMEPNSIVTDDADYKYFVKVMVCALYGHGVQGRVGGVKSILLSQAQFLIEGGTW